jgi:predicted O-methyltransferase YrrM
MPLRSSIIEYLKLMHPRLFLQLLVGKAKNIFTHTSPRERVLLYDEATLSFQNGVFLEIGSYVGASAVILAEAIRRKAEKNQHGKVICVDTWRNDAMTEGNRDTWKEFMANTNKWQHYIVPVKGHSNEVELPCGGPLDLVFIDGDHSYEGVKADANRFANLVRNGGRLIFHDQDRPGVARVIGEVLQGGGWRVANSVQRMISLCRTRS